MRSALVLAVVLVAGTAQAGLMVGSIDDDVFGPGSLTRDAVQDLDFLDLSFTRNMSYTSVESQLLPGGTFEGFRFATESEVISLVNNFGFSPGAVAGEGVLGDTGSDQLSILVSHLSWTLGLGENSTQIRGSQGFTSTVAGTGRREVIISDFVSGFLDDRVNAGLSEKTDETGAQNFRGSFLVRSSPEPTSAALMLVGVCGVLLYRMKT